MTVESITAISGADASSGGIEQYGVLPWRTQQDGSTRIMLVTSPGGRWIVPRGWPEKNEPALLAASREAFEASGVIGDIYPAPLTEYRSIETLRDGSLAACGVVIFSMKVYGTLIHWREKDQRERRWFTVKEAAARLEDRELAEFLLEHGPFPTVGSARVRWPQPAGCA